MDKDFDYKRSNDTYLLKQYIDGLIFSQKFLDEAFENIFIAGGLISMERLKEMGLIEFAEICGRNNIHLKYDKNEFQEKVRPKATPKPFNP